MFNVLLCWELPEILKPSQVSIYLVNIFFSSLLGVNVLSLAFYRINFGYNWDISTLQVELHRKV
jgi:hypothetical protein